MEEKIGGPDGVQINGGPEGGPEGVQKESKRGPVGSPD